METKNREKLLLMGVGACVALWLLNMLVFSPLIDSWHSRSGEIDKLHRDLADGARLIRRESVIRQQWDFMRANALNSDQAVAERQMFTAFGLWANSGGVAQGSFRPQVQDTDSNFTTVDCHADVSGAIKNVSDFLKAMSRDPLADKLDTFVLTSKDDNGQQLTLDLNLSGLILTDAVSSLPAGMTDSMPTVRDTNSAISPALDPFRLITRNNIFDQSRFPRDDNAPGPRARPRQADFFTYHGLIVDDQKAFCSFEGSGASSSRLYKAGDSINGFKIAKFTLDNVTLTNASNNFVVPVTGSLRREENGAWRVSADVAATAQPDANSIVLPSSTSAPAAGLSREEEILKKRRELEDK